ncbi:hypothetical protein [Empedobacter brevis]|uniref:hypothetical protein n=1 Tax=Empedobacter brevis TaxID=247 RepID=UPI0039AEAA4D
MSKSQVQEKLGKPFKIGSRTENSDERIDLFYYKEVLWTGLENVSVENILIFKNDILIEIKQGTESDNRQIVIKKND